ncbi:MAG TPA: addiction module protein [Thermoanaerobaculia bacterium]|nr:addiction module protein [Thermoanaerobaculia bacterium]
MVVTAGPFYSRAQVFFGGHVFERRGAHFRHSDQLEYNMSMTRVDLTRRALELPIEEQIELAQTLWEHASPAADFTLSNELKDLLEARLLEARANPEAGMLWEDVKARLLDRA